MDARINVVGASILGCLMSGAALAQGQFETNQMQGMMTAAALGVVVYTPPTGPASFKSEVMLRSPGVVSVPPSEWSATRFGAAAAGHPDYSNLALRTGINLLPHAGDPDYVEFGGISTGGDVCPPILSTGALSLTESFYFLSVTVAPKSSLLYGTPGSLLRGMSHPERAILSYYAEDSEGIDSSLVDATVVEQTTTQLGYSTASTNEVRGLDLGMGPISADPEGIRSHLLAPVRDRFYFSLSKRWLTDFPDYLDQELNPLNAQTIYVMRWVNMAWTAPEVAFTPAELFGQPPYTDKELDAISVYVPYVDPIVVRRVVYSATLVSGLNDEIYGYDAGWGPNTHGQPFKTNSGTLFSEKLQLSTTVGDRDDVKGTCGTDPHAFVPDGMIGIPMGRFDAALGDPLGLTLYRSITGASGQVDVVNIMVNGIDVPAGQTGDVIIYIGLVTIQDLQNHDCTPNSWSPLTSTPVAPGSTTASIELPGNLGDLGPVCVAATLHLNSSPQATRGSWITVLDY